MKTAAVLVGTFLIAGCLTRPPARSWNLKELSDGKASSHNLQESTGFSFKVSSRTMREIAAVYERLRDVIKPILEVDADLLIVESETANAFAALRYDKPVICITSTLVLVLGDDMDLYAALLSHEVAHLAWGHLQDRRAFKDVTAAVALLTPWVGGPANMLHLGLSFIEASYSRDEEREADALGVEMMIGADFNPNAAVRFHQIFRNHASIASAFFATHPPSEERIRNIRRILETNKSK